jgi:hypothetical protein
MIKAPTGMTDVQFLNMVVAPRPEYDRMITILSATPFCHFLFPAATFFIIDLYVSYFHQLRLRSETQTEPLEYSTEIRKGTEKGPNEIHITIERIVEPMHNHADGRFTGIAVSAMADEALVQISIGVRM